MKRNYESPKMYAETFVPNQYCKGCGLITSYIPATEVRCQSDGHQNSANDMIFLEGTTGCVGIYDPTIKNDNCHPGLFGWNSHGRTTSGTGYFTGKWTEKSSTGGDYTGDWFELNNGNEKAYRGFFKQGDHNHVFYVREEQQETMHLS